MWWLAWSWSRLGMGSGLGECDGLGIAPASSQRPDQVYRGTSLLSPQANFVKARAKHGALRIQDVEPGHRAVLVLHLRQVESAGSRVDGIALHRRLRFEDAQRGQAV